MDYGGGQTYSPGDGIWLSGWNLFLESWLDDCVPIGVTNRSVISSSQASECGGDESIDGGTHDEVWIESSLQLEGTVKEGS